MKYYGIYIKDERNSCLEKCNVFAENKECAKEKAIQLFITRIKERGSFTTREDLEIVRIQNDCGEKI